MLFANFTLNSYGDRRMTQQQIFSVELYTYIVVVRLDTSMKDLWLTDFNFVRLMYLINARRNKKQSYFVVNLVNVYFNLLRPS